MGLVHLPGLGPLLGEIGPPALIEIEPQAFWSAIDGEIQVNDESLTSAALGQPVLIHSVGYPVGGRSDGDPRQVAALRQTFECLKPIWWSEHASFTWAGSGQAQHHLGFLMPPVQSAQAASIIADRIKRLQDLFGLPFAFETGVNYFRPRKGELSDGEFWGEIADQADCGILLDLHNLWTNAANGREALTDAVFELPLDRVWEIHMAAGELRNGYWLDSHSGLPSPDLVAVAAAIAQKLPSLHAVILEIIPDYIVANDITAAGVCESLLALRRVWDARGGTPGAKSERERSRVARPGSPPTMEKWEEWLELALALPTAAGPLRNDPGVTVYRELIAMARRGMLVEALPLTLRYLLCSLGREAVDALFAQFWSDNPVQPFMSDEARAFAAFVGGEISLAHLDEILNFEIVGHQSAITRQTASVMFTCEPEPLFRSLMGGLPPDIRPCIVEVEITPPYRLAHANQPSAFSH